MARPRKDIGDRSALDLSVTELRALMRDITRPEFDALAASLNGSDTRKGVMDLLEATQRRLDREEAEAKRLSSLYEYESELCRGKGLSPESLILGMDEVGRGPLAGPLTIGAVVLPRYPQILGLNDSKQVAPRERERISREIEQLAIASATVSLPPAEIDAKGMSACLRKAFAMGIAAVEEQGVIPDIILIDGNPLRIDARECNVVKGDAKCASISAASILAKTRRDAYMIAQSASFPQYEFHKNKGYASAAHIAAIEEFGLSDLHRCSFCTAFAQPRLF